MRRSATNMFCTFVKKIKSYNCLAGIGYGRVLEPVLKWCNHFEHGAARAPLSGCMLRGRLQFSPWGKTGNFQLQPKPPFCNSGNKKCV